MRGEEKDRGFKWKRIRRRKEVDSREEAGMGTLQLF